MARSRLSDIERGHVLATPEELRRLNQALDSLIQAKSAIDQVATAVGWPSGISSDHLEGLLAERVMHWGVAPDRFLNLLFSQGAGGAKIEGGRRRRRRFAADSRNSGSFGAAIGGRCRVAEAVGRLKTAVGAHSSEAGGSAGWGWEIWIAEQSRLSSAGCSRPAGRGPARDNSKPSKPRLFAPSLESARRSSAASCGSSTPVLAPIPSPSGPTAADR